MSWREFRWLRDGLSPDARYWDAIKRVPRRVTDPAEIDAMTRAMRA